VLPVKAYRQAVAPMVFYFSKDRWPGKEGFFPPIARFAGPLHRSRNPFGSERSNAATVMVGSNDKAPSLQTIFIGASARLSCSGLWCCTLPLLPCGFGKASGLYVIFSKPWQFRFEQGGYPPANTRQTVAEQRLPAPGRQSV
jgi:hypothetical protein